MQSQKAKKLEFPGIAPVFKGRFPDGHVNTVKGWNFPREEVLEAARLGRMIIIDMDIGGKPHCSLRCGHCFNPVLKLMEKRNELLDDGQIRGVVLEAKALGLRSMKILGPGEPLENKALLQFLEFLSGLGVQPMVFTKGAVFGDDSRCMRIHGMGPASLARRLKEEFDVSIGFGANSFNPETQASVVKRRWYPSVRNRAIELLADSGFNEYVPGEPTRLAIVLNPILRQNADEVFEVYRWARIRHMYVASSPLMVSGSTRESSAYEKLIPEGSDLFDVYVKINLWAIENGIYGLDDLVRHGISAYAGGCQCQQLGLGLFVRRDGVVMRCPGNDANVQGDVKERSLTDIWLSSENYNRFRGMINVGCPPKEHHTFPENFFERVLEEVKAQLAKRT